MSQIDGAWRPVPVSTNPPPDAASWLALVDADDRIRSLHADQVDVGVFRPVDAVSIPAPITVWGLHIRDGVQLLIPAWGSAPLTADNSQVQDVEPIRAFIYTPGVVAYWFQLPLAATGTPDVRVRVVETTP